MDNNPNNPGKKIGFFCGAIIVLLFVVIAAYMIYKLVTQSTNNAKLIEKAQNKCKEYVDLACKFPSPFSLARIRDGTNTPRGMFPHQVFLFTFRKDNFADKFATCGGSIISERFVLTAAHCTAYPLFYDIAVMIGTLDAEESNTTLIRRVKQIHKYPDNNNWPPKGDLALLELEKNLEFNSNVRPICLNTKFEKNKKMIATGWGKIEDGKSSKYLNMVELQSNSESDKNCNTLNRLRKISRKYFDEIGICLAHRTKGINFGDSGGPLQVKFPSKCENTWEQIGITSAIDTFDYTGYEMTASIFVKVEYYLVWIAEIVWPDKP